MEEKQITHKHSSQKDQIKNRKNPFSVPPLIRMNATVDLLSKDVSKKHKTKSIIRIVS
jgi:hypothetical protein